MVSSLSDMTQNSRESTDAASIGGSGDAAVLPDFSSASYKDAYSRINAIVIEGEIGRAHV